MGKLLFVLFTVVPVVELALLVQLGGRIGTGPTIGLVLFTGVVGAGLAKHEGTRVFRDWQAAMAQARLPADGVVSGLLVLVGGVLLLTPGLLTDVVGFSLLIPPTRRWVAKRVQRWFEKRFAVSSVLASGVSGATYGGVPYGPPPGRDVIDVEVPSQSP